MHILKPITITPNMFTANNVPINDFPVWNAATNYTAGAKVIYLATNKIYRSISGGVFATAPHVDAAHWFDEGYVNAYKLIDELSSSQTSMASNVTFTIDINQGISSLAFINLVGETLIVSATNNGAESIYSKTISLDASAVATVYDWFFEPFVQKTDHFEIDFPESYVNPIITVTVQNSAGNAKIGRMVCAKAYEIGFLQYSSALGIRDYSIKTTDANNIVSLTKKDNVKLMSFKLVLNQSETNRVTKLLRTLTSVPCVFVGANETGYEYTISHGFYQSFRTILQTPTVNYCELDIEELI